MSFHRDSHTTAGGRSSSNGRRLISRDGDPNDHFRSQNDAAAAANATSTTAATTTALPQTSLFQPRPPIQSSAPQSFANTGRTVKWPPPTASTSARAERGNTVQFSNRTYEYPATSRSSTSDPSQKHHQRSRTAGTSTADQQSITREQAPRLKRGMTGMLDIDRPHTRRDRTFAGSNCVVCDEPLENTLRGERILQLSCAHVSHEACFYEFIREFDSQHCPGCDAPLGLDSSRGGNVLDIAKLSSIVRSLQPQNQPHHNNNHQNYNGPSDARSTQITPVPWDRQDGENRQYDQQPATKHRKDHSRRSDHESNRHMRSGSEDTMRTDSVDAATRRQEYDQQAMEMSASRSAGGIKNPIPPPTVLVRSEYPTLTRSRQQQSLTCLITVEVSEGKWEGNANDMPSFPVSSPSNRERSSVAVSEDVPASYIEPSQSEEELERLTESLHARVDNWHGLDFSRFGKLKLHAKLQVGKDRQSWQELECFLFAEMLICVKEKKVPDTSNWTAGQQAPKLKLKCTLKGSIMIKKHLDEVDASDAENGVLSLNLSVPELPGFHLHFAEQEQLRIWERALNVLNNTYASSKAQEYDQDTSGTDEDEYREALKGAASSRHSSYAATRSNATAPTEYSDVTAHYRSRQILHSIHVPVDVVVVIPVSSSMHGLKITLLRDTINFLIDSLGPRDRMGLVTFGSSNVALPLVGMTTKLWPSWGKVIDSIRATGQKSPRADLVEGANVAMDMLMQRKTTNPLASVLIVSDSSTADTDSIDFVVSRAEAAKVSIYCFGLGLTHKPDTMIELSTRTKASYTYVKDWMMLRECVAGCLGSLQSTSHQNVKLKLKLPDGSPAKFAKISGALQITKRANGRDAEAILGDLRFGDKRDILVQLAIAPENTSSEHLPQDPWESIVSGLEALGGPLDQDENRSYSVEEVPMIQADLVFSDILRDGTVTQLPRPSLLAISMLPASARSRNTQRPSTPPIPPHPSIVQRRMELLTSDMLTRGLTLVTRGQHERAHHLLRETRTILKGLGKGGLPPLPPSSRMSTRVQSPTASLSPRSPDAGGMRSSENFDRLPPSPPPPHSPGAPAAGIDTATMSALDIELESALEWINHPAVFGRDSRKAVLQAIGVISSQRAYTFRTSVEALWAQRVGGIKLLTESAKAWRESNEESLPEEA